MTIFTSETLSIYPSRLTTNRGNGYLQPFAIGNPYSSSQNEIFPNHDCNNTFGHQPVLNVPNGQHPRPRRRTPVGERSVPDLLAPHSAQPELRRAELRRRREPVAAGRSVRVRGLHDRPRLPVDLRRRQDPRSPARPVAGNLGLNRIRLPTREVESWRTSRTLRRSTTPSASSSPGSPRTRSWVPGSERRTRSSSTTTASPIRRSPCASRRTVRLTSISARPTWSRRW